MNILTLTLQLLQPYSAKTHEGIARLFANNSVAMIGNNAFLMATKLTPEQVKEQIKPHLVRGEFACVFTASRPADWVTPQFIHEGISAVLRGETSSVDSLPPVEN